ncbi:NO-inducible flavohemoprotein [bacterium M00.F.Ca.ET.228.01.1.1]|uniref:NO-inducible flavohemoprotein n=1 Tax=Paraburkholderia phenoliruptrix TaxID=252970 RepID=UPI001092DAB9|nr:NO-inducible flavohemoprotein [Paraburkholderia phenoliruptrix]TGP41976.1 NO-inducible flavohemoprotein [bacterium M00.F.Ca.ET.228.01.1.1]TGR99408.1 NO-inducible flavohemoprotein [bacterium M00.F.Ca.ET.191.01.1.1]TGU03774.1 NO-inducible flavohemoprotein [bacterium M00.F.Ca.ET.155.01.1.1]MBW0449837.1 NO-inducible flavohemoprotein [Paraburkholderia phenoliruptrix]MBW9099687.1 NO-inducible flavohemoprotein [Paraburkholderia phenoliruptrix]
MTALTADQIARVKATVPVLAEHGTTITRHFYKRMFAHHPELKNLFNQTHQQSGNQPETLARAVYAYAANIDNLGALGPAVSRIANKHASLNIRPEHYPIVGRHLLGAIVDVLGDAVDQPTLDAWQVAYGQLANIFVGTEAKLYEGAAWSGFRPFKVARKQVESDEITSFYLTPADGAAACGFEPGQYVSVTRFVDKLGVDQPRQYSLSDAPHGKWLRISVKREDGREDAAPGHVSNLLHADVEEGTVVHVSAPMGDFTLERKKSTPVVLMSGGVGVTPMISMLSTLLADGSERSVSFVHACRNGRVHAFREWLNETVAAHPNVKRVVFYEAVEAADRQGVDYDFEGRLDVTKIADRVIVPDADYYICGPVPFMRAQRDALTTFGVEPARIHTEVFGSGAVE